MTPDEARQRAEAHEREIDRLLARHGKGVRPGWVSAELAICRAYAKQARERAGERK